MEIWEMVLMGLIVGGATFLLYRSLWKKRGYCHGCGSGKCELIVSGGSEDGSKRHCDRKE
jgi:hypothetical protein